MPEVDTDMVAQISNRLEFRPMCFSLLQTVPASGYLLRCAFDRAKTLKALAEDVRQWGDD